VHAKISGFVFHLSFSNQLYKFGLGQIQKPTASHRHGLSPKTKSKARLRCLWQPSGDVQVLREKKINF